MGVRIAHDRRADNGGGTDARHYSPGELERLVNHWREVR